MKKKITTKLPVLTLVWLLLLASHSGYTQSSSRGGQLLINDLEYLEMQGLNVMLAHDFYPESHQGGVGIIQNGLRVGTNGDIRLEATPGQWQPIPKVGERVVDRDNNIISVRMGYPDPEKDRIGFNPLFYPDLTLGYNLKITPEGNSFRIIVDLDEPLPDEWVGKVGFNFELFPGILFGKSYYMDDDMGMFQRQLNGPGSVDEEGTYQVMPMAKGKRLTVAPESDRQRMVIENVNGNDLELIDGRAQHNNGWYVVRSLVPSGVTTNAIEWLITPHAIPGWKHEPVIQVSQVGYHPSQQKVAVIETDLHDTERNSVQLIKIGTDGNDKVSLKSDPKEWGKFLRYNYLQFDFSEVTDPGLYMIQYGDHKTHAFQINPDVYKRDVWQPTLEYFLPVQMCHVRVNDRYKVWHGLCHMDDAHMAPVDINHFDGYVQGPLPLLTSIPVTMFPN